MAICDCGAETSRLQVRCTAEDGKPLPQPWVSVCPQCSPDRFERWQDPSNKHGGFRYQYEPEKYTRREMPDGSLVYEAKDERNADLEAQMSAPPQHEVEAIKKRRQGPKHSLNPAEVAQLEARARGKLAAMEQARLVAKWMP